MAANNTVIVLAPNGHRQKVKVTPNTTILQILEEVCQKQSYNADDYDIKHFRRILDLNMIFRFTNLPNNAQLEMVTCTKARAVSNVTIGIQAEDGGRAMREFSVNTTLAQALLEIYPDSDLERSALIYMHREVYGKEALEKTTLKSLGLNGGKAILRLIYRDPQQVKTQAHVSTPLVPKPTAAIDGPTNSKNYQRDLSMFCGKTIDEIHSPTISVAEIKSQKISEKQEMDINAEKVDAIRNESQKTNISVIEDPPISSCTNSNDEKNQIITKTLDTKVQETTHKIELLGERNALIFNQAIAQRLPRRELPDSFFDLDIRDAKILIRDARRQKEELENSPLLTETQRRLNQDQQILSRLNKYRYTVLRILFPDQFVLQALFEPLESIQTIKNFIRGYLNDPNSEFIIYTTPPKHILNPDARLIEENLVPSAIVYYSGPSLLKPTVKAKLTDPKDADAEAIKSRGAMILRRQDPVNSQNISTVIESGSNINPGPSNS